MVEPVTVIEDTFKAEGIKASLEALITLFKILMLVPAVRVGWTLGAVRDVALIWRHDRLHTFNLDTFNNGII
jgi:hypothetical protein